MTAHYSITQGTEEWDRIRYGKIGGTRSGGLFIESDNLLFELLSEHTEEITIDYDEFISSDMMRGRELEPLAREEMSKYIGIEFIECGWLQSDEFPLLGISPDGISHDETVCIELKCPANKAFCKAVYYDAIPKEYINQCLHYFTVNPKLQELYFGMFRPENKKKQLFVKRLTKDSEIKIGRSVKPVRDWVKLAQETAETLQKELDVMINNFGF